MKHCLIILITIALLNCYKSGYSQTLDNPGNYMTALVNAQTEMNQKYMQYVSKSSHGASARKQEKVRQQVLESITNSRYKTTDLPFFKGDNELRKACIDYISLCYNVFNEDYNKIVNMEEIAEQSFDEMQAVILLQEKTSEKLKEASDKMGDAFDAFAAKYNIKVTEEKSELGQKMDEAARVHHYKNIIYLIFFKCNWQDNQMAKAINDKKINDIEQARNSLIRYADEGLKALDTIKAFSGDNSLVNTCKMVLRNYKKIAEKEIPKQTDYLLKEENFAKMKNSFESKGSSRTKEEVDNFNKSVKEINEAVNISNQALTNAFNLRKEIIDNWNEANKQFSDIHMPYYKK